MCADLDREVLDGHSPGQLSGEELERQRALDRSWESAQRLLSDERFRAYLEATIEHEPDVSVWYLHHYASGDVDLIAVTNR